MVKNRNLEKDVMKGILIFLVVLAHAQGPAHKFIYLFHMSCFFIISGYFWKDKYVDGASSFLVFFRRKMNSLYKPFVLYNIIFLIISIIFPILVSNTYENDFSYPFFIGSVIKIFLLRGRSQLCDSTWFLSTLLQVTILYSMLIYIFKSKKIQNIRLIQFKTVISIVSLMIGGFFSYINFNLWEIGTLFSSLSMFSLGNILFYVENHIICDIKKHCKYVFYITFVFSLLLLSLLNLISALEIRLISNDYDSVVYFYISGLLGYVFVKSISNLISHNSKICKMLVIFSMNSLKIMCMHMFAFKFVILVQCIINRASLTNLSAYPIYYSKNYWWIAYTIIGIAFPLCVEYLLKKLDIYQ